MDFSGIVPIGYLGPGFSVIPAAPGEVAQVADIPKAGEVTGEQGAFGNYIGGGMWPLTPAKSVGIQELGAPNGYAAASPGTYANYRLMLEHPTLQLVRAIVHDQIIAGDWDWDIREGADQNIVDFVKQNFGPLRDRYVRDSVRAIDYGWAGWEKIWDMVDGKWVLKRLKPLLWDACSILADQFGNFAGLRPVGVRGKTDDSYAEGDLPPNKALLYSYDSEAGNLHGRSRLENIRRTIADYYTADDHIERLSKKASGIVAIIKVPPGGFKDASGKVTSWMDYAKGFGKVLISGAGYVVLENVVGMKSPGGAGGPVNVAIEDLKKMAGTSLWDISTLELGDSGPAIGALTGHLGYLDELIFRGYLQPSKVGLQGKHGNNAETTVITDTGTSNSENVHADMTATFNSSIDEAILWNFGAKNVGCIRAKARPMRDAQEHIDLAVMQAILANAQTGPEIFREMDFPGVFDRRGVQKRAVPLPEPVVVPPVVPLTNGHPPNGKPDPALALARELEPRMIERIKRMFAAPASKRMSLSADGDGHWVTMDGEHVFIGGGGTIEKGPAHLVGKKPSQLSGKSLIVHRSLDDLDTTEHEQTPESLKAVEDRFPKGKKVPPIAVEERNNKAEIIDGHHRAMVLHSRGELIPTVSINGETADALRESGYDNLEISAAMVYRATGSTAIAKGMLSKFGDNESTKFVKFKLPKIIAEMKSHSA